MHFHDAVGNGKAQTGAFSDAFCSKKRFKYFLDDFVRDAGPGVLYFNQA